ncbi:MAG: pyrimidine reductase [Brevinema sp.]
MKHNLPKMILDAEQIKMKPIYKSDTLSHQKNEGADSPKIREVYGFPLNFGDIPEDRPLAMTSLVSSIDGRIIFPDEPEGPKVARENRMDPNGALADWWILNLLRTACDGIIIGINTLIAESDYTGHIFDQDLEDIRIARGQHPIPWNIITTVGEDNFPFDHILFQESSVRKIISVPIDAISKIESKIKTPYFLIKFEDLKSITPEKIELLKSNEDKLLIIATGSQFPDSKVFLNVLRKFGLQKVLVESPGYMQFLLSQQLMDEFFLNRSCLYIGGNALSIGQSGNSFTVKDHPHAQVLSIHAHSDYFFYYRYQFIYNR